MKKLHSLIIILYFSGRSYRSRKKVNLPSFPNKEIGNRNIKMKKLHLLVIKSYLGPLALTFFIAIFLLLMQFLWKWIDELVGKGLEIKILAELMIYTSARLVRMALVLAILLSSIMTFGNLGEKYELVAIKSSGISLITIMKPLIVFHIILSVCAFYFANYIEPKANLKFYTLLRDIRQQRPEFVLKEGVFDNTIQGYSIRIGRKNNKNNTLYDIMIYDHTDNKGNTILTKADSGHLQVSDDKRFIVLSLYNGLNIYEEKEETKRRYRKRYPFRRDNFEHQEIILTIPGNELERSSENLYKGLFMMLNINQLDHAIDSLYSAEIRREELYIKRHINKGYYNITSREMEREKIKAFDKEFIDSVKIINTDSLFNTFNLEKKEFILGKALQFAREAKNNIDDTKKRMHEFRKNIHKYEIEWHRKFTLSIACLIFFFIGAPLGAIIRKGGMGMPVVVSVLFFLIYYIISITGEKYARVGTLSADLGMWISTLIIIIVGFFLTYKATKESSMMNIDNYFSFIQKYIQKFKKNE
ncbi:LptF/LptG family permease [Bacteroidota bacterium]